MTPLIACAPSKQPCSAQGFKDGAPIDREFFDEHISGGHNILLSKFLWPEHDQAFRDKFSDEKEALFRKYACESCLHSSNNHAMRQNVLKAGVRACVIVSVSGQGSSYCTAAQLMATQA